MSVPHHILEAAREVLLADSIAKKGKGSRIVALAEYVVSTIPKVVDQATCKHLTFKYRGSGYHECLRCGKVDNEGIPKGGMLIYGHDCSICRKNAAAIYNDDGATPEYWALPQHEQAIVKLLATLHVERGREIVHEDIGL